MFMTVLTICPEAFSEPFSCKGEDQVRVLDIREFVPGSFRAVDDSPYGGGAGMVVRLEPVTEALARLGILDETAKRIRNDRILVAALSPAGTTFTQKTAEELRAFDQLVLICGHYEGLDERIYRFCDQVLSIGDYVISCGELAARIVLDVVLGLNEE